MTYLLDTHTFLWLLNTPEMLPRQTLNLAVERGNKMVLSLATPWEMAIKEGTGKLEVSDILSSFQSTVTQAGYTVIETTVGQAIRSGRLPLHHKDPFDRLLAAQALELRIPIISRDAIFDRYGVTRIWN
jgi:PIN domain nuclease of toxin-antitoxin system